MTDTYRFSGNKVFAPSGAVAIFADSEAAEDLAHALNVARSDRLGIDKPSIAIHQNDGSVADNPSEAVYQNDKQPPGASRQNEDLKTEAKNTATIAEEAVDPLDLLCRCGHEMFKHTKGLKCTGHKCRCTVFSEPNTNQPITDTNPHTISPDQLMGRNRDLLDMPVGPDADLALELAHELHALFQYAKRQYFPTKEEMMPANAALFRFQKEYEGVIT